MKKAAWVFLASVAVVVMAAVIGSSGRENREAQAPALAGPATWVASSAPSSPLSALTNSAKSESQKAALAAAVRVLGSPTEKPPTEALSLLGQRVLAGLPTRADLRGLTDEDVHQIAKPIFAGSLTLKLYADQLEDALKAVAPDSEPFRELATQGAQFYEKCASGEETPESIRAVCFLGFVQFSYKSGHPENITRLRVPADVLRIANAI